MKANAIKGHRVDFTANLEDWEIYIKNRPFLNPIRCILEQCSRRRSVIRCNGRQWNAENCVDYSKQDIVLSELKKNTKKALNCSVFGAPTYVIDNEVFWGQDRLDFVERYIKRLGS